MCLLHLAKKLFLSKHYFAKLLDLLARIALIDPDARYFAKQKRVFPSTYFTQIYFTRKKAVGYRNHLCDLFILEIFAVDDCKRIAWRLYCSDLQYKRRKKTREFFEDG